MRGFAGLCRPARQPEHHPGILKPLLDREFLKQREAAIAAAKMREWSHAADDIYFYASDAHD